MVELTTAKPIINLLPLEAGEKIQAVLPVREYADDRCVFRDAGGTVKKTCVDGDLRSVPAQQIAISLNEGDALVR